MHAPHMPQIVSNLRANAPHTTRQFVLGRVRPIASLAEVAGFFDGFRRIHTSEHHSELAALDWLSANGVHPVARHRIVTLGISKDGSIRAQITHLPDHTVRVQVHTNRAN